MLNAEYLRKLGIELMVNYNRKSRADEDHERKTGEDTLKSIRDLMDRVLLPLGIPYDQEDEVGSGDKISSRPVFQRVIQNLEQGKYQAIAVKEITRMGRGSYTDMGTIYDLIQDKNIFIITPNKVYDPRNAFDLKTIRFELFMAREEFEMIRERLVGGRYNKALEGRWMAGKPPFGYDLNPKTRKLEINEDEAKTVRLIYDLYANGILDNDGGIREVGHRALCTYLKRLGVPSPNSGKTWYPSVISYLVTNEVYIGTMTYGATKTIGNNQTVAKPIEEQIIIKDAHPAIVDIELWTKAKTKDDMSRLPEERRPKVKLDAVASELTGLVVCKKCGNRMLKQFTTQKYTRRTDGEKMVYKKEFLWCRIPGCNFVKYRAVEDDLIETMKYLRDLEPDAVENVLNQMANKDKPKETKKEDLRALKEKKLQELKNRMSFIYNKFESGFYSDNVFLERKSEIEKEMAQLQKVELNEPEKDNRAPDYVAIQTKIASFVEAYENTPSHVKKNEIFRTVFDFVIVDILEKGRGSIPAKHVIYPVLNHQFYSISSLDV